MFKINIPITKSYKGRGKEAYKLFVEGYASDPTVDRDEERFDIDAIKKMEDTVNEGGIPIRIEHEDKVYTDVGVWEKAKIMDDDRLYVKGWIDTEMSLGNDMSVLLKRGKQLALSVGGLIKSAVYEYNKTLERSIRVYKDVILKEISIIKNPSNYNTELSMAKSVNWSAIEKGNNVRDLPRTTEAQKLITLYKTMKKVTNEEFVKIEESEEDSVIEKKVLTTEERNALPDSSFAYVTTGKNGKKVRKMPIHDAAHVRNALAVLGGARGGVSIPAADLSKVKAKVEAAAKKFKVGKYGKACKKKPIKGTMTKWYSDVTTQIQDLFNKMEIEVELTESDVYTQKLTSDDLKIIAQLSAIMQQVDLPEDGSRPEILDKSEYWESLTEEMQIVLYDRMMVMPHHNEDLSLNKELVLYQLKRVVDGGSFYTPKEYTAIINHLYRHLKDLSLVKREGSKVSPKTEVKKDAVKLSAEELNLLKACHDFVTGVTKDVPMNGSEELSKEQIIVAAQAYDKILKSNILNTNPDSIMKTKKEQVTKEEDKKDDEVVETPEEETTPEGAEEVVEEEATEETPEEEEEVAEEEEEEEKEEEVEEEEVEEEKEEEEEEVEEKEEEEEEKEEKEEEEVEEEAEEEDDDAEKSATPEVSEEIVAKAVQKATEGMVTKAQFEELTKSFSKLTEAVEAIADNDQVSKISKKVTSLTKSMATMGTILEKMTEVSLGRKALARPEAIEKSFSEENKTSTDLDSLVAKHMEEGKGFAEAYKLAKQELNKK